MGLISLLFHEPAVFLIVAIPLLYSIILHELAHGFVAYLFGDDTAKKEGRLSLDPFRHLDLMGTLALFFFGFGWAKPVPVDFTQLKFKRLGLICVSLAGCAMNIFIAIFAVALLKFDGFSKIPLVPETIYSIVRINIILGSFNLIPIPPLDGSKIIIGLLPRSLQRIFLSVEPYGFFILIMLLVTKTLDPVINYMQRIIVAFMGLVLNSFM